MENLESYFTNTTLKNDFRALSDPKLDYIRDRDQVNRLVINFTIKHLAEYCGIFEKDIGIIRQKIRNLVNISVSVAAETTHCKGYVGGNELGADNSALRRHSDIRKTAALVKEVAFSDRFDGRGDFIGVDIGSGTGILTAAMALAAERKRVSELFCVGIEKQQRSVDRSKRILERLLSSVEVSILQRDDLAPGLFRDLFSGRTPDYLVCDPASFSTPRLKLPESEVQEQKVSETDGGSFMELLKKSEAELPEFRKRVMEGESAMFPDIYNGRFVPDKARPTLHLVTGGNGPQGLDRVGEEFEAFEGLI